MAVLDAKREGQNYRLYSHAGTRATDKDPVSFARTCEDLGIGEIVISSIDRDGTLKGYDIPLIRSVAEAVRTPVIASGGAGQPGDALYAVRDGLAHAIAAASLFHFTEVTPLDIKKHLHQNGVPVRLV